MRGPDYNLQSYGRTERKSVPNVVLHCCYRREQRPKNKNWSTEQSSAVDLAKAPDTLQRLHNLLNGKKK